MTFLGKLDKWARKLLAKKEEEKPLTGRRVRSMVRYYGIAEMAAELEGKKPFFRTVGGTVYAIAVNKKGEPTNFIRVGKDPRPPKVRKRQRRYARMAQQAAIARATEV